MRISRGVHPAISFELFVLTRTHKNHHSQDRDLKMFENAKWIIENKSENGKPFIWAQRTHK
jgi:erythromycin esterase